METPQDLQPYQIVQVWNRGLSAAEYENGIIQHCDYINDEFEVLVKRGIHHVTRIYSSADIEVPQ